ncbi:chorismate mutase [Bacillus pacificus]
MVEIVQKIGEQKQVQGTKRFDQVREREVLDMTQKTNEGPFETSTVQHIFKTIFDS